MTLHNFLNIGSVSGLSPIRHQDITWINVDSTSIRLQVTHLNEISFEIQTFLIQENVIKMSSAKWRLFRLSVSKKKCYGGVTSSIQPTNIAWWRHQMETFSALLAPCVGIHRSPAQRPVTRSFDVFFDPGLNKCLSTQALLSPSNTANGVGCCHTPTTQYTSWCECKLPDKGSCSVTWRE